MVVAPPGFEPGSRDPKSRMLDRYTTGLSKIFNAKRGFIMVLERYLRQEKLLDQDVLSRKRALVVGAGGLGNFVATELVLAGVGHVTVVDPDVVKVHNLNRQFLFAEGDVGQPKARVIARRLAELNPTVEVLGIIGSWRDVNVNHYDVVFDCMDIWEEKRELMRKRSGTIVFGSVGDSIGMVSVLLHKRLPFEKISGGRQVLAAQVGIVGSIMALEGLRELNEVPSPLRDRLLHIDFRRMLFTVLEV